MAENICQSINATLISIHSAEENKFAMNLANKLRTEETNKHVVWIGAKRNNSLVYFEWSNGEKLKYSNWANNEPEYLTDPESQVAMYHSGTWATFGKDRNGLYICESNSSSE